MNSELGQNIFNLLQLRYGIIGKSQAMQEAIEMLLQAAPTDLTVLITGETGTGKEIFANALHGQSSRKKHPYVSVNCGAIPETLLESELFGHEKGAFTSAVDQRKGYFEVAHKGTIFLDEIGEMPVGTQVKLLRVLESGEFSRLGSSDLKKVDVRVIAATNRDLEKEVSEGTFRQDLYYRLNNVHIKLPPLRSHLEDIPLLTDYFSHQIAKKHDFHFEGISRDAENILKSLPWPGNVRELRNLIETIVTLEKGSYITPDLLTRYIPPALPAYKSAPQESDRSLVRIPAKDESQDFELRLIFRTLLELQNDISELRHGMEILAHKIDHLATRENVINISSDSDEAKIETDTELDELRLDKMEKKLIETSLRRFNGNRRQAAEALGISERTLYRKISEYDIV